jgi:hypothetical protein
VHRSAFCVPTVLFPDKRKSRYNVGILSLWITNCITNSWMASSSSTRDCPYFSVCIMNFRCANFAFGERKNWYVCLSNNFIHFMILPLWPWYYTSPFASPFHVFVSFHFSCFHFVVLMPHFVWLQACISFLVIVSAIAYNYILIIRFLPSLISRLRSKRFVWLHLLRIAFGYVPDSNPTRSMAG